MSNGGDRDGECVSETGRDEAAGGNLAFYWMESAIGVPYRPVRLQLEVRRLLSWVVAKQLRGMPEGRI